MESMQRHGKQKLSNLLNVPIDVWQDARSAGSKKHPEGLGVFMAEAAANGSSRMAGGRGGLAAIR
jgi:hypothetical protein